MANKTQTTKSDDKGQEEEDQSLTSILDPHGRSEFTVLLASITATMRKSIESNFDPTATLSSHLLEGKALSADEKLMNPDVNPATADVNQYEKERKLKADREKEVYAPKMQELKVAALENFDEWRETVILRVGEIVNSKETARRLKNIVDTKRDASKSQHKPEDKEVKGENEKSAEENAVTGLPELYPPVKTPLAKLDESKRVLIIHSLLLLLLSLEHYTSYSRVLLLYVTSSLSLPLTSLSENETKTATSLLEAAKALTGDAETQKKAEENAQSRKWKVGLATVAGAAIVGISGGLAAPLVAAGVGSVMGGLGLGATAAAGYLGSVAGSTVLVGGLFGAYGGRMTGQMMDKYAREVEDFAFEPVKGTVEDNQTEEEKVKESLAASTDTDGKVAEADEVTKPDTKAPLSTPDKPKSLNTDQQATKSVADTKPEDKVKAKDNEQSDLSSTDPASHRLRLTIGISGWLTSATEVSSPWKVLVQPESPDSPTKISDSKEGSELPKNGSETFGLRWELEALLNLGNSMNAMVGSAAWGYAQKEIIGHTIFAELMSAMWPIGMLKIAKLVDNPFSVAKARADKAGEVLADALINRAQGERPVSLVGYSLGARVIYSCLQSLARRQAFGLVESAVLIGSPCPSLTSDWRYMRTVVAGRLVNVYTTNDYILGFMYRTSSIQYGIAGLEKVQGLPGVENVDVTSIVNGHLRYRYLVGRILQNIGWEDVVPEQVEREAAALKKMDDEEEKTTMYQKVQKEAKAGAPDIHVPSYALGGKKGEKKSKEEEEQDSLDADKEVADMQKQVQEKTQQSYLMWAAQHIPTKYIPTRYLTGGAPAADVAADAEGKVPGEVKDVKDGAGNTVPQKTYAQWAMENLPTSYLSSSGGKKVDTLATATGTPGDAKDIPWKAGDVKDGDATKQATGATQQALGGAGGYVSWAKGHLPSLPIGKGKADGDGKTEDKAADTTAAVGEKMSDLKKGVL
ncbi:hypothetical protein MMC25_005338 [Agyrium rufum]|nr:hypothetical protein [Agyrium rufum]